MDISNNPMALHYQAENDELRFEIARLRRRTLALEDEVELLTNKLAAANSNIYMMTKSG